MAGDSVREEVFSLLKHQKKLEWFTSMLLSLQPSQHCVRMCVCVCVCVCVNMLVFPDNLFKPGDRAIAGKEMQLRSKRWVPSQSLTLAHCFFFVGRFILISYIAFACEGGARISGISTQNMLLLSPCQDFCSNSVSSPPSLPHLFIFLPDRSTYWLGRNARLRC